MFAGHCACHVRSSCAQDSLISQAFYPVDFASLFCVGRFLGCRSWLLGSLGGRLAGLQQVYSRALFAAGLRLFGGVVADTCVLVIQWGCDTDFFIALESAGKAVRSGGWFMLNRSSAWCACFGIGAGDCAGLGPSVDLPIIKWICVVFIRVQCAVAADYAAVCANVVLPISWPPGSNFDLILPGDHIITLVSLLGLYRRSDPGWSRRLADRVSISRDSRLDYPLCV